MFEVISYFYACFSMRGWGCVTTRHTAASARDENGLPRSMVTAAPGPVVSIAAVVSVLSAVLFGVRQLDVAPPAQELAQVLAPVVASLPSVAVAPPPRKAARRRRSPVVESTTTAAPKRRPSRRKGIAARRRRRKQQAGLLSWGLLLLVAGIVAVGAYALRHQLAASADRAPLADLAPGVGNDGLRSPPRKPPRRRLPAAVVHVGDVSVLDALARAEVRK